MSGGAAPKFWLTDTLSEMLRKASQRDRAEIKSQVAWNIGAFEKVKGERGANIAYTISSEIDAGMERTKAISRYTSQIKCRRGCSHCCRQNVAVTLPEAELALEFAADQGVEVDWEGQAPGESRRGELEHSAGRTMMGKTAVPVPPDPEKLPAIYGPAALFESRVWA